MSSKTVTSWRAGKRILCVLLAASLLMTTLMGAEAPASADDQTIPAVHLTAWTRGQTFYTDVITVEEGAKYQFSVLWEEKTKNNIRLMVSQSAVGGAAIPLITANTAQNGTEFDLASGRYTYSFTAQGDSLQIYIATPDGDPYCEAYMADPTLAKVDDSGSVIGTVDLHPDFSSGWGGETWGGIQWPIEYVAADFFETLVAPQGKMYAILAEGWTAHRASDATVTVENGASYVFSILWKSKDGCAANFMLSGSAIGDTAKTLVVGNQAQDAVAFDKATGAYSYAFTAQGDSLTMTFNGVDNNDYTAATYAAAPALVKVDGSGSTLEEVDCDANFDDIWTIGSGWSGQIFSTVLVDTDFFSTDVIPEGYVKALHAEGWTEYRCSTATVPVENGAKYVMSVLWRVDGNTKPLFSLSGSAIGEPAKTLMIGAENQAGVDFDFETGTYRYAFTAQGDSLTMSVQCGNGDGVNLQYLVYFAMPSLVKVDGSGSPLEEVDCDPGFDKIWAVDDGWSGSVFTVETLLENTFGGRGDANRDCEINIQDLVLMKKAILAHADDSMLDMNRDNVVDEQDFNILRDQIVSKTYPSNISYGAGA